MKLKIGEMNERMTALEAWAQEAKDDARTKYEAEMLKLCHKSNLRLPSSTNCGRSARNPWRQT